MSQQNRQQHIFDDKNSTEDTGHFKRREDHETHTTALVFLVLSVVAVVGVALSLGGDGPVKTGDFYNQNQQPPTTQVDQVDQVDQESHGSVIPVEQVQAEEQSGLSGLPADIYLPEDREVVRNFSAELTDTTSQRVVIFDTDASAQTLKDGFTTWVSQSNFAITSQSEGTIRSENDNKQLVMSISETDDRRRVQVNYIQEN